MRKTWIMMLVLGLGCASTGESDPTLDEFLGKEAPSQAAEAHSRAQHTPAQAMQRLPDSEDARWTTTHYNLTLTVEDPAAALGQARTVLMKGSAVITNSNRQAESASLNATTSPETYAKLLEALEDLDGEIIHENSSHNDMGAQVRQLRERLELARRADTQLSRRLEGVHGDELDALMFLHELNARERQNLENQIRSFWDQAGNTYVYLTFQPRPA